MKILSVTFGILLMISGVIKMQAQTLTFEGDTIISKIYREEKKHDPRKATMYSAVLPGLGQIYNKKYWKVPIVYGGFAALGSVVVWNGQKLSETRQAYFDLNDANPETNSYKDLSVYKGYTDDYFASNKSQVSTNLKSGVAAYRRQRDLMVIVTVGFYLLNILDANVDAHFIDFDIGEDLSVDISPTLQHSNYEPVFGAQLAFTF